MKYANSSIWAEAVMQKTPNDIRETNGDQPTNITGYTTLRDVESQAHN